MNNSLVDKQMLNEHAQLISQVAARYTGFGVPLSKLIEGGYRELIESARRFDANRGFPFKVYASWSIKSALAQMVAQYKSA